LTSNSSPQLATATALVDLLTAHPELSALEWSLDTVGVLHGYLTAEDGRGRIVDEAAAILGGTPVRASIDRDGDRVGLVSLASTWHGVNVEVWASYAETAPRRPLGTVAVLPAPADTPAKAPHNAGTCAPCSMLRHPSQRATRAALAGLPRQGGHR